MSRVTTRYKESCIVPDNLSGAHTACGPTDQRCNDPDFARANPDLCGTNGLELILRPAVSNILSGETIQYTTSVKINGIETALVTGLTYSIANVDVATINASTGLATGASSGSTTVTVRWHEFSAQAQLSVTITCTKVAIAVLVNNSHSASLDFGVGFSSRLAFSKAMAVRFLNALALDNAEVGIVQTNLVSASFGMSTDRNALLNYVNGIPQTTAFTAVGDGIATAITMLNNSTAPQKVMVLLTDGEQRVPNDTIALDPITEANIFKDSGGLLISVGVRASGDGFALLSEITTPGYFLNALPDPNNTVNVGKIFDSLREFLCHPCSPTTAGPLIPFTNSGTGNDNSPNGTCFSDDANVDQAWQAFDDDSLSVSTWTTNALNTYLSYQFLAGPTTATTYTIRPYFANEPTPKNWVIDGSNNGSVWTTIDTQTNIADWEDQVTKVFSIASPGSYSYYRIKVSATVDPLSSGTPGWGFQTFQLYAGDTDCTQDLFSIPVIDPHPLPDIEPTGGDGGNTYTVTRSFTACCPPNQVGDCVTRSATYTSTISMADADVHATALARSAAFADLDCCAGFPIQIIDTGGGASGQPAVPYPSCVKVTGFTEVVGTLKVHINGLSHTGFRDTKALLMSPNGTSVLLWQHVGRTTGTGTGSNYPLSNVDLVIADSGSAFPGAAFPGTDSPHIVSGTYSPTQFDGLVGFPSPAPAVDSGAGPAGYSMALSSFAGEDPNGTWKLFVTDDTPLDSGSITSWALEIDGQVLLCDCTGTTPDPLTLTNYNTVKTTLTPCTSCALSSATEWAGTLALNFGVCIWTAAPSVAGSASFQGSDFGGALVELISLPNGDCVYVLKIRCLPAAGSSVNIWIGEKVGGLGIGPVGRYFRIPGGCSATPDFIDIQ